MANWLFQANPERYDALRDLEEVGDIDSFSVGRHVSELTDGDRAALWIAGRTNPGVYALGHVTGAAYDDVTSDRWVRPEDRGVLRKFCPLHFDRLLLDRPIDKETLFKDPRWSAARIRTQPQAANPFRVTDDEWNAIEERAGRRRPGIRNPAWTTDELVLALDLYMRHRPTLLDDRHSEVVELSALLNSLPIHTVRPDLERFRNANGVAMKLANFAALDPDYPGRGLDAGGKRDAEVWDRYCHNRAELAALAAAIRAGASSGGLPPIPEPDEEDVAGMEGRLLYRRHRARERNDAIVKRKKESVLRRSGRLACEACGFDFERAYGDLGRGYIECHHLIPLGEGGTRVTRLDDLAVL